MAFDRLDGVFGFGLFLGYSLASETLSLICISVWESHSFQMLGRKRGHLGMVSGVMRARMGQTQRRPEAWLCVCGASWRWVAQDGPA
jgi:hypothetical protein